ncbi:MAG: YbjN domain-containing protein [Acidimicrobiales bacterium]
MPERHDEAELARLAAQVDGWAARQLATNPLLEAVERDAVEPRWLLRLAGEDKEHITVWLTLRERTLHHECLVLPAPEEGHAAVFEHLLRANARMYGMAFAIGAEDAVYLRGQVPLSWLDDDELDRVIGSSWQWTERHFAALMQVGFASRLKNLESH